jgi:hypothetical protein
MRTILDRHGNIIPMPPPIRFGVDYSSEEYEQTLISTLAWRELEGDEIELAQGLLQRFGTSRFPRIIGAAYYYPRCV